MADIIHFPSPPAPVIKEPLNIMDVQDIGFVTRDERNLWIKREQDIIKIMRFIIQEKIAIVEEESVDVE